MANSYDPNKSPLRGSLAADHIADTQRLIAEGQAGAPRPPVSGFDADPHVDRVSAQAQAESAARRARMAGATPGNAAPAAAAESVAAKTPFTTAADAAKNAGSKLRGLPGQAAGLVGKGARAVGGAAAKLGTVAAVGTAAAQTATGAGDSDYDARFGIHNNNPVNNSLLRGLGIPESVLDRGRINQTGNPKLDNALTGVQRLPIDAAGATQDFVSNAANTVVQGLTFGNAPQIGFADQSRMRAAAINPPAAVTGAGGGGTATPATAQPVGGDGTYRTADGRVGLLPPGITVAYGKDGRPAFGGGQSAESQKLLQGSIAQGGGVADSPLRRPDLANMGSGFNQAPSRAGEINKYFDGIAKQIQDLHGSAKFEAKGSLATKLLEVEKARAAALGQNAGQLIDSQGQQVADLANRRNTETGLYNTDSDSKSSALRDKALERVATVKEQFELLKDRQAATQRMSEDQLKMLDQRATAAATDADGKVDLNKKQQIMDAAVVNTAPAFDGSAATAGEAAAEGADAASIGVLTAAMNKGIGAGNESSAMPHLGRLREPTLGEAFDRNSNVTIGDNLRRLVDGIPFVDDSRVYEATNGDKRVLRKRDTTRDQRDVLRRRQLLDDTEE